MTPRKTTASAAQRPAKVGEIVTDTDTGRTGEYRGTWHGRRFIRPIGGGQEWDAPERMVRPATPDEAMSAKVEAANRQSRERSGNVA